MNRVGRPRRGEENPDSAFGEVLKDYIHRLRYYTQKDLARDALIPPETLSKMVKGRRKSGTEFRRDLRSIIRVLREKNALFSLDEANYLITRIPAESSLDPRDPQDAKIIALFNPPEEEQAADQSEDEIIVPDIQLSSDYLSETPVSESITEPESSSQQEIPFPESAPEPESRPRQQRPFLNTAIIGNYISRNAKKPLWWVAATLLVVIILIIIFGRPQSNSPALSQQTSACSDSTGVTLYTEINYRGQCHTFGPGDYELASYGLEENVSSIRDANNAYYVVLYDKGKNFYKLDASMPVLPAEWDNRADTIHIEKHRPTTCHPGANGIIAYINTDYSGGCLFITHDIPDLTPLNFDSVIVSIQFIGNYRHTRQLVIYKQPDYKDECGAYWQDQSDLLQCARNALSVRVLPFTPPTPIPTTPGTRYVGNVAPYATLSPGGANAAVDGNLQTEWTGGHMVELDLKWAVPVTVHRVVVWDRKQSSTDNNQINKLKLSFSDGTSTGSIDMISQGPRCADVTFPEKTISWLHIIPVDASGNNGYREVEVWATTGPQYSDNTCVNKKIVPQTIPQVSTTYHQPLFSNSSISWLKSIQPDWVFRRTYHLH